MSEPLSKRNSEVARLRAMVRQRAARREAGRFVVEGVKLVGDVLASGLVVFDVYVDAEWDVPDELLTATEAAAVDIRPLAAGGIERIASTSSPQPVVAEVKLPSTAWPETANNLLVAVDVNDPGNVGTLARSAAAAGFDALIALGETADPFGPKTIRASAGTLFELPVVIEPDVVQGLERVAQAGLVRVGTRMHDAEPCDQAELSRSIALVLGSEAHGLGPEYERLIDRWVRIPMAGNVESLNVAMAGTIVTYEIARQGRGTT